MTTVGADVTALRWFAALLRRRRGELETWRAHLTARVDRLAWSGADRDRFVDEWHRIHAPSLDAVADDLGSVAAAALDHAARQEQASRPWS